MNPKRIFEPVSVKDELPELQPMKSGDRYAHSKEVIVMNGNKIGLAKLEKYFLDNYKAFIGKISFLPTYWLRESTDKYPLTKSELVGLLKDAWMEGNELGWKQQTDWPEHAEQYANKIIDSGIAIDASTIHPSTPKP